MAKLLVVEDEALVRLLVVETLESEGHVVLEAPDGEIALALLNETPDLDLIVTDVRMPRMDGFSLGQRARRLRPGLRLLFITGYVGTDVPAEFSADRILRKPFNPDTLVDAVGDLLRPEQTKRD